MGLLEIILENRLHDCKRAPFQRVQLDKKEMYDMAKKLSPRDGPKGEKELSPSNGSAERK